MMIFLAQQEFSRREIDSAAAFAVRQRSLRSNVRCAHSFAFGCAVRSVKSVYELIICVEIRISDDICTMDPTFVYMLVKSKNQYTGNFGFSLKTADFMKFWYIYIVFVIFVV